MQLKKKFTIKKQLAAGAVTAVMLVSAFPAFASDNGLESRGNPGLHFGLGAKIGLSSDAQALQGEIRDELKDVRKELNASAKAQKANTTNMSAEVTERKRCKKDAETQYRTALEKARDERDGAVKTAQQTYLNGLKTARDAFHVRIANAGISLGLGQLTLSATANAELKAAREAYQQSVKAASQIFNEAKKKANASNHEEAKAAKVTRENAAKACKA